MKTVKLLFSNKGDMGIGALLTFTIILIFIIFPLTSVILEKYILNIIGKEVCNDISVSLNATYISLNIGKSAFKNYDFNSVEFKKTFESYLIKNMKLNSNKSPKANSLVDGKVEIKQLKYYNYQHLPYVEPTNHKIYNRPFIKVEVIIPLKPHLYRRILLKGQSNYKYKVRFNASIPIDE